jgi:hypothetical protein
MRLPLAAAAEAHRAQEGGDATGSVVLAPEGENGDDEMWSARRIALSTMGEQQMALLEPRRRELITIFRPARRNRRPCSARSTSLDSTSS